MKVREYVNNNFRGVISYETDEAFKKDAFMVLEITDNPKRELLYECAVKANPTYGDVFNAMYGMCELIK